MHAHDSRKVPGSLPGRRERCSYRTTAPSARARLFIAAQSANVIYRPVLNGKR